MRQRKLEIIITEYDTEKKSVVRVQSAGEDGSRHGIEYNFFEDAELTDDQIVHGVGKCLKCLLPDVPVENVTAPKSVKFMRTPDGKFVPA